MQGFKTKLFSSLLAVIMINSLLITASCKKNITETLIYDNVIYNIDTVPVYSSYADKSRLKTPLQYISSLYSNLYFSSIPGNALDNLVVYRLSIGDKTLVNEMILNAMLQDPAVQENIPSVTDMRIDIDAFIDETYLRFYLRKPTEYEKFGFKNIILADEDITPTDIYRAFLLSNEYQFY